MVEVKAAEIEAVDLYLIQLTQVGEAHLVVGLAVAEAAAVVVSTSGVVVLEVVVLVEIIKIVLKDISKKELF